MKGFILDTGCGGGWFGHVVWKPFLVHCNPLSVQHDGDGAATMLSGGLLLKHGSIEEGGSRIRYHKYEDVTYRHIITRTH